MSEEQQTDSIMLTDDKGVQKRILQEGTGEVQPFDGCKVLCHYTGKLTDGTQFDSSVGREPFEFELGAGSVIKGFDLGVASMRKGEKSLFTFTPGYAYGSHGSPPNIPGNSTLIFEVRSVLNHYNTSVINGPKYLAGIVELETTRSQPEIGRWHRTSHVDQKK